MVQVNVAAVTQLTRLLLPGMLARGRGRVMNVASTAAFQPGPLMAVYYATKAYVLSLSEAIADELRETPVTVTAFCPGATATEFNQRGNISKNRPVRGMVMDSVTAARIGYEGMQKGRRLVIPGWRNRWLVRAGKFSLSKWVTSVARRLNRKA
jgi:short-subunit dehydrogenase